MKHVRIELRSQLPGFKMKRMSLKDSERIKILEYQEMISEINSFKLMKKNGKPKPKD